jgi:hypothetical protein
MQEVVGVNHHVVGCPDCRQPVRRQLGVFQPARPGVDQQVVAGRAHARSPQHLQAAGQRRLLEQDALHQVVRHAVGPPGRRRHRVLEHGQARRVDADVPDQPGKAAHQDGRTDVRHHVQHDQQLPVARVLVQVLAGQDRTGRGPRAPERERRAAIGWRCRLGPQPEHLGAHVDQQHLVERALGAVGDAAHLLHQVRGEGFQARCEDAGRRQQVGWRRAAGLHRQRPQAPLVLDHFRQELRVAPDQVAAGTAVLSAALVRPALGPDQG